MSGTLALSSFLVSLDRAGLASLVRSRKIATPNSVHDALDLASELLKPDSVTLALTSLDREELAVLTRFTLEPGDGDAIVDQDQLAPLAALGLIGSGPLPLPEVSSILASQLKKHGISASMLDSSPAPPAGHETSVQGASDLDSPQGDTSGWFASALAASGQVAWVLRDLTRSPGRLNRNGSIASVWVKSVEERLNIPRSAELIELMRSAGLTVDHGTSLHAANDEWLAQGHAERWIVLARAAAQLMPTPMREVLASAHPGAELADFTSEFPHRYPLAPKAVLETIDRVAELWERLGVTTGGLLSAAGLAIASNEPQLPPLDFPAAAPGVYIQPDLSVVVPGLLPVDDEALLASVALPEQIGVASTLRISEASLSDAFDRGMDADSIRDLLARLSLTGIPQPLEYLITTLAARSGSIVVSIHGGDEGRTQVDFVRPGLRASVLVDRRLAHLQLHEASAGTGSGSDVSSSDGNSSVGNSSDGDTSYGDGSGENSKVAPLFSRLRADHVLAALVDARYPAVADRGVQSLEGAAAPADSPARTLAHNTGVPHISDAPRTPQEPRELPGQRDRHRTHHPHRPNDPHRTHDPIDTLADRVFEASQSGPSDIGRQITLAIRAKTSIRISVEINGDARDFTIVPVSLSAGRLRALDETAGVERTLPVDAITSVSQAT